MTDQTTEEAIQNDQVSASTDPLNLLVGEGKKFKSVEDLARSKIEADNFIEKLKSELKGLREELDKRMGVEELYEQLVANQSKDNASDSTNEEVTVPSNLDNTKSGEEAVENQATPQNPNDIESLVEKVLKEKTEKQRIEENNKVVLASLRKAYGEKAGEEFKKGVESLGLSEDAVNTLVKDNPKALLKLLGVEEVKDKTNPAPLVSGSDNPSVNQNTSMTVDVTAYQAGPQPKSYFDKLKKTLKPSEYWSPKVQMAMHKSAQALGEDFFK